VFTNIKNFIKQLITKDNSVEKTISTIEADTKPLSAEDIKQVLSEKSNDIEIRELNVSVGQSIGLERDHNEDSLFSITANLSSNASSLLFGFYVVADGMGGHLHGEIASATAVRVISEHVMSKLYAPLFGLSPAIPDESITEILEDGVFKAHNAILEKTSGGGTTLTSVLILGKQMTIAHVGDSRVYRIKNNGTMESITRDHSLVKRLEELGQITAEEAAVHPQRNVLYRALGQGEPFEPEIFTNPLPEDGYLLICSDGLWGVVPEVQIGKIITESSDIYEATDTLVKTANAAGGPDNITAILIKLSN